MENVKQNYKSLLLEYEEATKIFQDTGLTRLLAHALENLERFERKFIELWSFEKFQELQADLGLLMTV